MAELLIELRSEEIPARMQVRAGADLAKGMTKGLADAGLSVKDVRTFTGPRRLVFVGNIPARSPDTREERKGPRVGSPERALAGFLRGAGLSDISEAEVRSDKKGEHYVAVIAHAGRDAGEIVAEVLTGVTESFPWPKSMTSGASDFRWVRPLRGIVAMIDGAVVPVEVGGIASGNQTVGHRQMGPGPYSVTGFDNYRTQLEGPGHVVLDHGRRKVLIAEGARAACGELAWVEDAALLDEVAGLVEWPVVLRGDMAADVLDLPEAVIRLTLKSHQKTFTVRGADGRLAPHFVVAANLEAPDGGATIAAGNAKVIAARLADAAFFISEDAKKKLAEHAQGLDRLVFHIKLGSYADKVERVAQLAREIAPHVGADPDLAERAARLAKADLVTQTVIEMTSLQGQIGRIMAEREGILEDVARAIEEHYKPQGPSDGVPTAPISVAVALADKLDSLAGFEVIGERATGSKDPYGLRRAALGVVRIVLEAELTLDLQAILSTHFRRFDTHVDGGESASMHMAFLLSFLLDRLEVHLKDRGERIDVVRAVRSGGDRGDFLAIARRARALAAFLGTEDGADLVIAYKRARNILKLPAEDLEALTQTLHASTLSYTAPEADRLCKALDTADANMAEALRAGDYARSLRDFAALRRPVDAFFDEVMVNDDDRDTRLRRLNLLQYLTNIAHRIADFSKLEG